MQPLKILMSNLGYARGINGCLAHHVRYAHRHVYCSQLVQTQALDQLAEIMREEIPDICCFVEIDNGSFDTSRFNQFEHILNDEYPHYDIENKYGHNSILRNLAFTRGKSNAFISRDELAYEKIHFTYGTKKLIYKITLEENLTLFFAHFSLKKPVRKLQLEQTRDLMHETPGEVIFMGDFNVLTGLDELHPLTHDEGLILMNKHDAPTFTFHKRQLVLDLCLCTPEIAKRTQLRVIPQPYSDHAALFAEVQRG
ncbi:MAG: endonuclease/exonuclease/phosphatase family protein [Alphaproteobacteria bacterium]|nr:endonuclease/exonuclease/phosphatase family protein [Alphaproteobacteria bacterium]